VLQTCLTCLQPSVWVCAYTCWLSYKRPACSVSCINARYGPRGCLQDKLKIAIELNVASCAANTGNYVLLNTPGGRAFVHKWAEAAHTYNDTNDQWGLGRLQKDSQSHIFCNNPRDCANKREEIIAKGSDTAIIRHYNLPWMSTYGDPCFLKDPLNPRTLPIDPCHYSSEQCNFPGLLPIQQPPIPTCYKCLSCCCSVLCPHPL
jgi:hypothetical protein